MGKTMKRFASVIFLGCLLNAQTVPEFRDLFNGKDLTGFVNVNTAEDTWKVRDGMLICSGHPIGVLRTVRQYENFVLHVEWMHMEAGGNSGVFAWSDARPDPRSRLPNGIEIQMLELEWPNLHKRNGVTPPLAYVHGELFGVGGVKIIPENPRGERSMSIENLAASIHDEVIMRSDRGEGDRQRGTVTFSNPTVPPPPWCAEIRFCFSSK